MFFGINRGTCVGPVQVRQNRNHGQEFTNQRGHNNGKVFVNRLDLGKFGPKKKKKVAALFVCARMFSGNRQHVSSDHRRSRLETSVNFHDQLDRLKCGL